MRDATRPELMQQHSAVLPFDGSPHTFTTSHYSKPPTTPPAHGAMVLKVLYFLDQGIDQQGAPLP